MRNRFVSANYFTAGSSVQNLDFIRLPLPHLPPPNNLSFSQNFLHFFHAIPVFNITCEIEKLPIDHARSKFFSDVLPHIVDQVNFSEHEIRSPKGNCTVLIAEVIKLLSLSTWFIILFFEVLWVLFPVATILGHNKWKLMVRWVFEVF